MTNIRVLGWLGLGTRYSPSQPSQPPTPGTPLPTPPGYPLCRTADYGWVNDAVGLISVGQLTLSPLFSGLRGITEVYNVVRIDNR